MTTTTSETTPARAPGTVPALVGRKIEKLLDAAFHELQHDTGPSDPEYVYQRNLLKKKFTEIMRHK